MDIEYVRELNGSYMRIVGDSNDRFMKMMSSNSIPGFLNTEIRKVNNSSIYLYNISSKVRIVDVFERKEITRSDMEELGKSINRIINSVEEYFLNMDYIMLTPEAIYIDNNTGEWQFAYCSNNTGDFTSGMKELFEYIIQRVCHKDNYAATMAYGIYKKICMGNCSPGELFEIECHDSMEYEIKEEHQVIEDVISQTVIVQSEEKDKLSLLVVYGVGVAAAILLMLFLILAIICFVNNRGSRAGIYILLALVCIIILYYGYKWYKNNRESFVKLVNKKKAVPYELDKAVICMPSQDQVQKLPQDNNMTVLLRDMKDSQNRALQWQVGDKTERYKIYDETTIIGSAADRADCVINICGISRIHAKITYDGSHYYIKDMNSTNGTVVNDKALACFEIHEIKQGDRIKIGAAECVFV